MKLQLKKYGEMKFEKSFDYDVTNSARIETDEWHCVKIIESDEIEFHFNQNMFKDRQTNEVTIDWKRIDLALTLLDGEIAEMKIKGREILKHLYQEIFNKSLDSVDGIHNLLGIQIVGLNSVITEKFDDIIGSSILYKFEFYLDSTVDEMALLDPYCKYYVYFTGGLYLSGAFRD
jgi:hypothetical protein